jgi:hypothetical protein
MSRFAWKAVVITLGRLELKLSENDWPAPLNLMYYVVENAKHISGRKGPMVYSRP